MWMKRILLFLLVLVLIESATDCSYARPRKGIRSVDFYNFTYETWNGEAKLKNGWYKIKDEDCRSCVSTCKLILLKYVDLNFDGKGEAVVVIRGTSYGSEPVGTDYYVFEYRNSKALLLFHEEREGKEGICVKNHSLIIIGPAWEGDQVLHVPHCCPPFTETKVYRWRGSAFVPVKTYQRKNYPFQNPQQLERARRCSNIRID
jgi:hypothetical protein